MREPGPTISIPLRTGGERRQAERFAAAMPVSVDGREGVTQDLSTTGLAFHSQRPYEAGTLVDVVIEYLLDGHHFPLRCKAEVVRSEADGDGWRIGARLLPQSQIAPVSLGEEPAPPGRPHLRSVG
jgi:hypothetical protein